MIVMILDVKLSNYDVTLMMMFLCDDVLDEDEQWCMMNIATAMIISVSLPIVIGIAWC